MSDSHSSILDTIARSLDRGEVGSGRRADRAQWFPPLDHTRPEVTGDLVIDLCPGYNGQPARAASVT